MKWGKRTIRLQTAIALMVCGVVILALAVTGVLIGKEVAERAEASLADKVWDTAQSMARSPSVIEALKREREEAGIQPFAEGVRQATDVEFVVVMDMNGIRKSHPDETKIGKRFVGRDEGRVLQGEEYLSVAEGTLGTSMRAFVPIYDDRGEQVGAVSVGILMDDILQAVSQSTRIIYAGIGVGILTGLFGALLLARKIKRVLFGLEPHEIAGLLEERTAMLESVREGILAINREGTVIMANTEAHRIIRRAGIVEDPIGMAIEDFLPKSRLRHVLESEHAEYDRELELNGMVLVVNRIPVMVEGQVVGAIATFRDKTELKQLAEQLTGVKLYADGLRAKTHEFMNQLHVILGMVHMGKGNELPAYIRRITDHQQMEIGTVSRLVKDPVLAGFLLSKWSVARERGVVLEITGKNPLPRLEGPEIVHELVTILGNLIENGFEAMDEINGPKKMEVLLDYDGETLTLIVEDHGVGIPVEQREAVFEKGFSTKGEDRGYGLHLVKKSVEQLGGTLTLVSGEKGMRFTVKLPFREEEGKP
ncbi:DcuS/MalK family sensor histidine kinase [Desmospora profundinema]|uniref:histidine kinase n=1 Tax=Desmospora profundinema TaxID=1571184 RepID=A0ABU1IRX1_9BACL|nr:DcuS/MalK family sensor histidine kinase [Desmospora profundinema]MDR6227302.1 CitB family two-component system sensor histidine kinase MalK [Desmospora profundinema]